MKRNVKVFFFCVAAAVLMSTIASGGEQPSIGKGRTLFNDPKLGTNGRTCNACHPDGKGLERSGLRGDLANVINGCITIPLKGTALLPDSVEMKSLVLYIKSLGSMKPASK